MSRLVNAFEGLPVTVLTGDDGAPLSVAGAKVLKLLEYYREWVGILEGEPQADVWLLETRQGVCEVRRLAQPKRDNETVQGVWLLTRWED